MTYALPNAATTDIDIRHWLAAFGVAAVLHAAVFLHWPADDQAGAEAPGVGGISVSIAMAASLAGADHASDSSAPVEQAPVEQVPVEQVAEALAEPTLPEPIPPAPVEPTVTPPIQKAVTQPVAEVPVPEIVPETVTETPSAKEITPVEQVTPVPDIVTTVEPPPEEVPVADPAPAPVSAIAPPPRAPVRSAAIQPPTVKAKPVEELKTQEAPPLPVPAQSTAPVANPNPVQAQQAPSSVAATVSSGQAANAPVGNATDIRNSTGGAAVSAPSPNYIATLRLWLERHKDYPKIARSKRMQGVVLVYFRVGREGTVLAQEIREVSGHPLLDEAALDMLVRATPLPEFPKDMPGDYLDVVLPVEYSLRGNQ